MGELLNFTGVPQNHPTSRWFQRLCSPRTLEKWSNLINICQGGWFNHQPLPSMYGIFTYIWLGKYTIHGSYGQHPFFHLRKKRYHLFVAPLKHTLGSQALDDLTFKSHRCLCFLVNIRTKLQNGDGGGKVVKTCGFLDYFRLWRIGGG